MYSPFNPAQNGINHDLGNQPVLNIPIHDSYSNPITNQPKHETIPSPPGLGFEPMVTEPSNTQTAGCCLANFCCDLCCGTIFQCCIECCCNMLCGN
uniref:CYSTM domain-containing protein n=1 Tax=Caenorhabditis tropicalis TaxID=1561998 RepID=A0A1I7UWS2_9PELO